MQRLVRYRSWAEIPESPGEPAADASTVKRPVRHIPFHPPNQQEAVEQLKTAQNLGLSLPHLLAMPPAPPYQAPQPAGNQQVIRKQVINGLGGNDCKSNKIDNFRFVNIYVMKCVMVWLPVPTFATAIDPVEGVLLGERQDVLEL